MKLTGILLLIALLHVSAAGLSQKVTLSVTGAPLEKVFNQIKQQTGFSFLWDEQILVNTSPVTLNVKDADISDVMDECLKNQGLSYILIQNMVVIKKSAIDPRTTEPSPPIDIHGHVTDSLSNPLAGASVSVKGSNRGTSTDENGDFVLHGISETAQLVISFTGYDTKNIKVNGNKSFAIILMRSNSLLDQIQVIAYGTTTQRLTTGNVSTVDAKTIGEQPISNPLAALDGRVPGLIITQQSGVPGAAFTVQLRGQNSIANGNDPLYIIDGVPFGSDPLNSSAVSSGIINRGSPLIGINPQDIESIDILKDADATSIYGSRGANGVILITTKKGIAGKSKVDINLYSGVGKITRRMDLLNTPEYLGMRNEAFKNDGASPDPSVDYDLTLWDTTRYTDWQKMLIGNSAAITNVQASISGGNAGTQYLVSGSYFRETTVFPGDFGDKKYAGHFNLGHHSDNNKFFANINVSYVSDNNTLPNADLTYEAFTLPPNAPNLYDSSGHLNWANGTFNNPYSYLLEQFKSKTDNLVTAATLGYNITDGLQIKADLGYTTTYLTELSTYPLSSFNPSYGLTTGQTYFSNNQRQSWIAEPQLIYKKRIGGASVNFLIGGTLQGKSENDQTFAGNGYITDALIENPAAASSVTVISADQTQYRYIAGFARLGVDWQEKYLLNISARRDGSSRFGQGNQFANFGAIGAAWIFSKEAFFKKNLPGLSFGKIRASFGSSGNDQIGDYQYLETYRPTSYPYQGNGGLNPIRLANPGYGWETTSKLEAAIDLGFFKDRILFSAIAFYNRSGNQLVGYPLPPTTGFASIQQNLNAVVQNTGLEFELNTINIKNSNFMWSSSFNISIPKNKLISFPNISSSPYAHTYVVGKSLFIAEAFHYTGVGIDNGVYQFVDVNHDGSITYPEDLMAIKEVTASMYGGLQNSLRYHDWELGFYFQFVKQTGRNYMYTTYLAPGMIANQPTIVLNRWQKPGDITNVEQFTQDYGSAAYTAYSNGSYYGDNNIVDASFIRLKNISLNYYFPSALLKKMSLQAGRIYLLAQNLLTITNYQGYDPENQSVGSLPPLRVITAGVQLTF